MTCIYHAYKDVLGRVIVRAMSKLPTYQKYLTDAITKNDKYLNFIVGLFVSSVNLSRENKRDLTFIFE